MERSLARSLELGEILVDSGNTTICLPADMIARLGLGSPRTVAVETGFGIVQARMFPDLELEVCGRSGAFACVEMPIGSRPTLGGVPMAALGLDVDVANHRLRVLPENGPNTYWRDRNVEFAAVAVCAWVLLDIAEPMRVATPAIRSAPVVSVHVPNAGVIGAAPVWGR